MPLVIRGGHIIDPGQGIDKVGDLLVCEGKIVQVGDTVILAEAKNLDATGLVVCPGFIDLHCHLREPGFEDKETIATGTKAAAVGGFATICCMPNTNPPLDNGSILDWLKHKVSDRLETKDLERKRDGSDLCPTCLLPAY